MAENDFDLPAERRIWTSTHVTAALMSPNNLFHQKFSAHSIVRAWTCESQTCLHKDTRCCHDTCSSDTRLFFPFPLSDAPTSTTDIFWSRGAARTRLSYYLPCFLSRHRHRQQGTLQTRWLIRRNESSYFRPATQILEHVVFFHTHLPQFLNNGLWTTGGRTWAPSSGILRNPGNIFWK